MASIFRIKRRVAGGAAGAPASLAASELAFNEQDNTLYYGHGNSGGAAVTIIPIAGPGAYQAKDGDLTALSNLTGTNTIYYRSAADIWSPVTFSGLTFSGGVLTASAGGGNVSNSGTPTVGQYGRWVTATTIEGVAPATIRTDIAAQPVDATLTALAAYNTNGLLTQTAADTFAGRTLTGPAAGISVTNGNGVSGNPTLALANDLAAIEALAGTNTIYYRSGTDTWTAVTIGTGLTFSSGTLAATGGGSATASVPHEGKLTYVSASILKFAPYNGDKIKINGTIMTIPTAGIAGLSGAGSSVFFVNGTGSQPLVANTTYWIYAFSNAGTVTADFRTASTHTQSTTAGNEGVEILTGNNTRTLIGICRMNATPRFDDSPALRNVRSWFNQPTQYGYNFTSSPLSTSSESFAYLGPFVEWVNFGNDVIELSFGCPVYSNSVVGTIFTGLSLDGSVSQLEGAWGYHNTYADTHSVTVFVRTAFATAEGSHYGYPIGKVTAGMTGTWWAEASAGNRPTIQVLIHRG